MFCLTPDLNNSLMIEIAADSFSGDRSISPILLLLFKTNKLNGYGTFSDNSAVILGNVRNLKLQQKYINALSHNNFQNALSMTGCWLQTA